MNPFVQLLYNKVPSFTSIYQRENDDLDYVIYGELGIQVHDEIIKGNSNSKIVLDAFNLFNLLSEENDTAIDNLLVVGVYEGFYYNKLCNDIARDLLVGRAKDLYEYWMKNGYINSNY